MSDFTIRDASIRDSAWYPKDHEGKLHMMVSRPNIVEKIETRYGMADVAKADLVIVFGDLNQTWTVYRQVNVLQKKLRKQVAFGGIKAGILLQEASSSSTRGAWFLDPAGGDDSKFCQEWVDKYVSKEMVDGRYDVVPLAFTKPMKAEGELF